MQTKEMMQTKQANNSSDANMVLSRRLILEGAQRLPQRNYARCFLIVQKWRVFFLHKAIESWTIYHIIYTPSSVYTLIPINFPVITHLNLKWLNWRQTWIQDL